MWTTSLVLISNGIMLLAGLFFGFFGAYFKKKGENLATHEDIEKLVEQMRAVTSATKEVEAKISDEVWARQRRWEVRRDTVFEALKELASAQEALRLVLVSCDVFGAKPDRSDHMQSQSGFIEKYHQARVTFARAKILAMVACSKEVRNQFDLVGESLDVGAKRALAGDMPGAWDKMQELCKAVSALVVMVRKDLGVHENVGAMPESG